MERRKFLKYAGVGICSSLTGSVGHAAQRIGSAAGAGRPNILYIMTDQQHAGMLSCVGNGDLKTPAMDRIAASGMRFERCYAPNPVCAPCRLSLQTGLMPSHVGAYDNPSTDGAQIPEQMAADSLGPLFHRAGYDCVYGGKVHLPAPLWERASQDGWNYICKWERDALGDACADYLKKPHDKPFFMFMSLVNPHDVCYMAYFKYTSTDLINSRFQIFNKTLRENNLGAKPFNTEQDLDDFVASHCPKLPDNFEVPEKEPEAITSKYLAARDFRLHVRNHWNEKMWRLHRWMYARLTERVDGNIAKALDALQNSDAADNTLVVFTSDHGDMDAAHRIEHKSIPYEEAVRVPFIMSYPGRISAGSVNDTHFVSNGLDLLPTLCDYAGISAPANLPGRSVRPLAEGKQVNDWRRAVVCESQNARMIRDDRFKYTVYDSGRNREFLVDLKNDPGEMKNIADDDKMQGPLNRMRQGMVDWVSRINDRIGKEYIVSPSEPVNTLGVG